MRRLFTTMIPLLLCAGVLGFAVGCSAPPSTPIALPSAAALPSRAASRPILYLTLEGPAPPRHTQMNAVSPDGSPVSFPIPLGGGATWSPDGRWIAYVAGPELRLTNTLGETKTLFATDGTTEAILARPMWSPDGRSIGVIVLTYAPRGPYTNSLAVIDVSRQKVLGRYGLSSEVIHLPFHLTPTDKFAWSPDGRKVLISWESAAVISVDTGRVETISRVPIVAEWAPDGEAVYYFEIAGELPRRELGGFYVKRLGRAPVTLMDARQLATAGFKIAKVTHGIMTLSPTGHRLAISLGSERSPASLLRVYDLRPGAPPALERPAKLVPTEEAVVAIEWAPDESAVAVVSLFFSDAPGQQPPGVRTQLLNLATDQWKVLASWRLMAPMEIEVFTMKVLSWTR